MKTGESEIANLNPYQSPGTSNEQTRIAETGLGWLLIGLIVFVLCITLVAYLMLEIAPNVKGSRIQRGLEIPPLWMAAVSISDHFVRYWYAWSLAFFGGIGFIEWKFRGESKRKLRRAVSIAGSILALGYTLVLLGSTLFALG